MSGKPDSPPEAAKPTQRRPRAFALDDPAIEVVQERASAESGPEAAAAGAAPPPASEDGWQERLATLSLDRSFRWGSLLFSAALALASLAFALWFTRFTAIAFTRDDWIGWVAFGLLMLVALAVAEPIARDTLAGDATPLALAQHDGRWCVRVPQFTTSAIVVFDVDDAVMA